MCGHRRLPWPRSRCRQDPSVRHDDLRLAARGACRQSYGQASRSCCRQRTAPPGVPAARATWAHPTSASPMRYPWSIPTLPLLRSFAMVASPSALAPRSLCERDRRVVGDWGWNLRPGLAARTGGGTWICGRSPREGAQLLCKVLCKSRGRAVRRTAPGTPRRPAIRWCGWQFLASRSAGTGVAVLAPIRCRAHKQSARSIGGWKGGKDGLRRSAHEGR